MVCCVLCVCVCVVFVCDVSSVVCCVVSLLLFSLCLSLSVLYIESGRFPCDV